MVSRFLLFVFLIFGSSVWAAEPGALRDPLRPLNYQVPVVPGSVRTPTEAPIVWQLGAVLISAERQVAVINGRPLQLGDSLDGYQLVKIEPASAVLQKQKTKIVLRRSGTGLKKAFLSRDVEKGSQP